MRKLRFSGGKFFITCNEDVPESWRLWMNRVRDLAVSEVVSENSNYSK